MVMTTQAEETSLIAQAVHDVNAFSELYNQYFPRIYNYVHYRVADYHTADDLISLIFEKLLSRLQFYQPEKASFSVWIFTIARNTLTDYYRSQIRTPHASLELSSEVGHPGSDPADIAAQNDSQQQLMKALAFLNPLEREIIALKFWSGLSNREIAKCAGISESNTGVILFRAIRKLRVILESQGMNVYD